LYPFTILQNIAFPTPALSDAPITAMDCGDRKTPFSSRESDFEDIYKKKEKIVINACWVSSRFYIVGKDGARKYLTEIFMF